MFCPLAFKLLAAVVLAVLAFAGPAVACVCADGASTVQPAAAFCDGDGGGTEESCEAGCRVTRLADAVPAVEHREREPVPPKAVHPLPAAWSIPAACWPSATSRPDAGPALASGAGLRLRCVILLV